MKDGTEKDTQQASKNSITLGARILALCDALDAMASKKTIPQSTVMGLYRN